MKVKVLYFASCREIVGERQAEMELSEGATVSDLVTQVASEHPRFQELAKTAMVSVNQEYVDPSHSLREGDEVAFIPPVSGGR